MRRARPPESSTALLEPEERVLAWAETPAAPGIDEPDGSVVLATPLGLWLPDDSGGLTRLPWHLITHVTWTGTTLTVTDAVEVEPGVLENRPPRSIRLVGGRQLPETVQSRFYNSRAHTGRHTLSNGGGVVVVGRRIAGQDGVHWYAVYDDPAQRSDPLAQAEVAELVGQSRALFAQD